MGSRIAQARREKAAREHRDILAAEVAEAADTTAANYSRWESDERVPREGALKKLAAFLGVTPAYLRYGVTEAGKSVKVAAQPSKDEPTEEGFIPEVLPYVDAMEDAERREAEEEAADKAERIRKRR